MADIHPIEWIMNTTGLTDAESMTSSLRIERDYYRHLAEQMASKYSWEELREFEHLAKVWMVKRKAAQEI